MIAVSETKVISLSFEEHLELPDCSPIAMPSGSKRPPSPSQRLTCGRKARETSKNRGKRCTVVKVQGCGIFALHLLLDCFYVALLAYLGAFWSLLGASWAPRGANLDALGPHLAALGRLLGPT